MNRPRLALAMLLGGAAALPLCAWAAPVGQIKTATGGVQLERAGIRGDARVGARVEAADRILTGPDGAVGITFEDNSVLSAGPNSVLEIERFVFDSTTHEGAFEARLSKGTLSAISGKIAKQTPEAMKIHTPSSILGVRGTEFLVQVLDDGR